MAQAQSVEIPKRLPLVIEPSNRGTSELFDARLVNCYMEMRKGLDGETKHWIYPRYGTLEQSRPPAGNATGLGVFNWLGDIYSIFGATMYKNGSPLAGALNTAGGLYRFDQSLGATPRLVFGNGAAAYTYTTAGGIVQISDGDFPAAFVKGWAYLNGTTYVFRADTGLQGSEINDPTDWDPVNIILVQIEPDRGVALAKQLVYVVALKQWSGEVFYDAQNSVGSPLGRVEGSKFNWGCLNSNSVREMDGALIWLGKTKNGSPEVVLLNNLKAESVSTEPVERLLQNADTSVVYSWTLKQWGHRFYILTLKNSNLTLAFDFDERAWSQWTDTSGNYVPIVDAYTNDSLQTLAQHESDGRLYYVSPDYATDNGTPFQVDIYAPNFDGGTSRGKQQTQMKIITDQRVGAELQVRYNDNDFDSASWSNFRSFDLRQPEPALSDWGTFVRRAYNFRYKSLVKMPRIESVDLQLDICTL